MKSTPADIRRGALALTVACALLMYGALGAAQNEPQRRADGDRVRFSEPVRPAGTGAEARLQIELAQTNEEDESLRARVISERGERVDEELPHWLTDAHYGFDVTTEELATGQAVVLLDAEPGVHADAPPTAPDFQIAWLVVERGEAYAWSAIDSVQHSTLDGGERLELRDDADGRRLVRLHSDDNSLFCGASGDDAVLYEVFAPDASRFEQRVDFAMIEAEARPASVSALEADFDPPELQLWYQWFAATSDVQTSGHDAGTIRPMELGDGDASTAWAEGVDGLGRGEFVSAQLNEAVGLSAFKILPGAAHSREAFRAHARPTRLLISLDDGEHYVVDLEGLTYEDLDEGRGLYVELPEPQRSRCVSFMILEADRGERIAGQPDEAAESTTIAELVPYSEVHRKDATRTARSIVENISVEDEARTRDRLAELALPLRDELVNEVRYALSRSPSAKERRRIIPLMGHLPPEEGIPMLIDYFEVVEPDDPEYRAIKRSLATYYSRAAPPLLEYLDAHDPRESERKYTDVIRLLGRVGDAAHLRQLIDDFGRGDGQMRSERVRAVGAGGEPLVEPLVEYARWHVNTDAGYDALRALNLIGKRLHYQEPGELPAASMYDAILSDTTDRRATMRAIRLARYFEIEDFPDTVRRRFSSHIDPLVRREALDTLEHYESEEALDILIEALEDNSPDVRIAAVSTLSRRDDVEEALPELLDYVRRENWRPGLQQAFRALADMEDERVDRLFEELLADHPNGRSTLLAAQALERAGRPVDTERARKVVLDESIDLELRVEMINLLGLGDDDSGEDFLLALLDSKSWSDLAGESRDQKKMRDRIILALGRRQSEGAKPRLLEMARGSDAFDLRQTAVRSLGFYRDEELLEVLRGWRGDAPPRLRSALDQTTSMIEQRLGIENTGRDIDALLEDDELDAGPDSESQMPDKRDSPDE